MINFYPGPSKLHSTVKEHLNTAIESGIISYNHRSPEFSKIIKEAYQALRVYLNIPDNYNIAFTSSATECWEITIQNFIETNSLHIFNGDFGKKWWSYANSLKSNTTALSLNIEEELINTELPTENFDLICLTHSETSNGTALKANEIEKIRVQYPASIIAIDATSSMAGISIDFKQADIWFASVQKCFGLPAGLAVMIYSEKAIEKAIETPHYNSFLKLHKNSCLFQTTHTPNTTGIYLVQSVIKEFDNINQTSALLHKRAEEWHHFISNLNGFNILSKNNKSNTVIAIEAHQKIIQRVISEAHNAGILLGKGYGSHKATSFRIANFPAITEKEIKTLKNFLTNFTL